ncbi:MAG: HD-GYP domain-containing protein, partial [Actinocrinis sp.]
MPHGARRYAGAVAFAALVLAAVILPLTGWSAVDLDVFFGVAAMQALIVLTSDVPAFGQSSGVPASVAVQLAAVMTLTPGAAAASIALGALCVMLRSDTVRERTYLVGAGSFLTASFAAAVYIAAHGSRTLMHASELPPVLLTALALSLCPTLLIWPMAAIGARRRPAAVLREALLHTIPRNVAYSLVGLLAAVLWLNHARWMAAVVMLGPLLVTRWAARQYAQQRAAHDATVRALVQAVEIKDLYTRGHSERVAAASEMIAHRLGLDEERISTLRHAAILHDVGKLGVPTRLLQKDGKFDAAELEAIRVHPVRGVDVVRDIAFLNEAYAAILHHHERMDGRGYPSGLSGQTIPQFARIIAVADAFDSMTSTRSYRAARPVPDAVAELRKCAGSQFDPLMVEAMRDALAEAEREGRPWLGDGTPRIAQPPQEGEFGTVPGRAASGGESGAAVKNAERARTRAPLSRIRIATVVVPEQQSPDSDSPAA